MIKHNQCHFCGKNPPFEVQALPLLQPVGGCELGEIVHLFPVYGNLRISVSAYKVKTRFSTDQELFQSSVKPCAEVCGCGGHC